MSPKHPSDSPLFIDRTEAGRRLANHLVLDAAPRAVVLGVPRGGVVVAAEVARRRGLDLGILDVRKRGPHEQEQRAADDRGPALGGRGVVIVDDGLASGETMRAAIDEARARGAGTIVVAVPVASRGGREAIAERCDDVRCPYLLDDFDAVGTYYAQFDPVSDEQVQRLLAYARSDRDAGRALHARSS